MVQKPFAVRYTNGKACEMVTASSAKEAAESFVSDTCDDGQGVYRVTVFDGQTMEMGDFEVKVVHMFKVVEATFLGGTK